jgi:hypothetical protein
MKKSLSLFILLILLNSILLIDVNKKIKRESTSKIEKTISSKDANQFNPEIDGLGSINKGGEIKVNGETLPLVIESPPFKVKSCNQIIATYAEYINDLRDYRKRTPAYYIISVFSVYIFQAKDATKLIHSSHFTQTERLTQPLKGARGCLVIDGGKVNADITICFSKESDAQDLFEAIRNYSKCRMGDNLAPISEDTIKKLAAACSAKEQASSAVTVETSLETIRPGNKWDEERNKFFQPKKIQVPGTPTFA